MPSSFASALAETAKNAYCNFLAAQQNAFDYGSTLGLPDYFPKATRAWRLVTCSNTDPNVIPASPFSGGQCITFYNVGVTVDRYINNDLVQEAQRLNTPNGPKGAIVSVRITDDKKYVRVVYDSGAQFIDIPSGTGPAGTNYRNLRDIVVSRRDGLPDNCGNPPPPVVRKPPFDLGSRDITFVNNNNINTTVSGNFTLLAPVIGSFNNVSFPIEVDIGGVTLEVNIGGDGDAEVNIPSPPGVGNSDPLPDPTPNGDPDPEDSETPIIGVMVSVTAIDGKRVSPIPQQNLPTLLVPRLATAQFRIKSGANRGWTIDLPIKTTTTYVPCPEPRGAVAVQVSAQPGITLSYEPVFGDPLT